MNGSNILDDSYRPCALERATVYIQKLRDTGRVCVTQFSGLDRDLVTERAAKAYNETDPYRSPKLGAVHELGAGYAIQLTTYSLD